MKKLLNTLFVTSEDAYLTLDGENVVVNREKQVTARFPLHALAGIISFSYAGASPALMGACAKRAGAWIEILHVSRAAELGRVAPFTGAWIEIRIGASSGEGRAASAAAPEPDRAYPCTGGDRSTRLARVPLCRMGPARAFASECAA